MLHTAIATLNLLSICFRSDRLKMTPKALIYPKNMVPTPGIGPKNIIVSGRCLGGVWEVFGRRLGGIREVCLEASGRDLRGLLWNKGIEN